MTQGGARTAQQIAASEAAFEAALGRLRKMAGMPLAAYAGRLSLRQRILRAPIRPIPDRSADLPDPVEDSLKRRVVEMARTVVGVVEHVQFSTMAAGAETYRLENEAVEGVAALVVDDPGTVERSLDLVRVPPRGVWIEWEEGSRRGGVAAPDGEHVPVLSAALFVPSPEDSSQIVMMTAWSLPSGQVRHSHAAATFSLYDLSVLAWNARKRFSRSPVESRARILANVGVFVPPGLADEIAGLIEVEAGKDQEMLARADENRRKAEDRAKFEVASDIPFAVAALLLLEASNASFRPAIRGLTRVGLGRAAGGPIAGLAARLGFSAPRRGFVRTGVNDKASVAFWPGAAASAAAAARQ